MILEKNKKLDNAKDGYREVLTLNPNHTKARVNLSTLLMAEENCDEDQVIQLLLPAAQSEKNNFEVNNNLGTAFLMKADYEKAILYYSNALASRPGDFDVKNNIARAYLQKEDYENAHNVYQELLQADSKNWEAYLSLGKIYMKLGDEQSALKMLMTLQKANPEYKASEVQSLINVITG